ncbi:hypothetical protein [Nonomuraea dietziae]|uniref:Uncharacterized protein n=1 Tax=Nonomuraea dietziae TaxID=65515 RepID=A0A7W5YD23_9ACTN|nr:hypothetical protein [Nonomuraea dietziae]MBB3733803.1 hypothetical protein [Nonomuraea dietziae]
MLSEIDTDSAARRYAATVESHSGGRWTGMYGPYSRLLFAWFCGPSEDGICVSAPPTWPELWERITEADPELWRARIAPAIECGEDGLAHLEQTHTRVGAAALELWRTSFFPPTGVASHTPAARRRGSPDLHL